MEKYIVTVYDDGFDNRTEWRNEAGQYHRLDGPAIECANGDKTWYKNGLLHRLEGPAVQHFDGYKAWYKNGWFHRLDGPAIEYPSGYKEYRIEGIRYTEQEFLVKTKPSTVLTPTEENTLKSLAEKLGYKLEKLPVK